MITANLQPRLHHPLEEPPKKTEQTEHPRTSTRTGKGSGKRGVNARRCGCVMIPRRVSYRYRAPRQPRRTARSVGPRHLVPAQPALPSHRREAGHLQPVDHHRLEQRREARLRFRPRHPNLLHPCRQPCRWSPPGAGSCSGAMSTGGSGRSTTRRATCCGRSTSARRCRAFPITYGHLLTTTTCLHCKHVYAIRPHAKPFRRRHARDASRDGASRP